MKLILAGGGGAAESRAADELFANWLAPGKNLLYWPIALRGAMRFSACYAWITSTFSDLDVNAIDMWDDLASHAIDELDAYAGVYIGGGNTYSLLNEMRQSGFDQKLVSFARSGKPVYGGSAGAVVFGRDIRTVSHIDINRVGLRDLSGLDLAGGHSVWVHYTSNDDEFIEAYVGDGVTILAIPEKSAVVIEDGTLRSVGEERSHVITKDQRRQI